MKFYRAFGGESVAELSVFDAKKSDCSIEKVNLQENTLIYLNQAYLIVKKDEKKIIASISY